MTIQPITPTSETGAQLTALPTTAGTVQLAEWAAELQSAHQLGTALCGTEFVPAGFRGKPEAAAAAILAGKSLGLDPMNALSNIFVVHGRPALYARTMVALVMAQGHEVVRTEATPERVTIAARRKGQQQWQDFTWTIQRARTAGYTGNKKYDTDPIAMLTAKAQAEACRTVAPDVLAGMPYSAEEVELEDMGEKASPGQAEAPKTRKLTRPKAKDAEAPARPAPEPAPAAPVADREPVADQETGEIQEPPAEAQPIDYATEIDARYGNAEALRELYNMASADGQPREILDLIATAGREAKQ